ncbi:hypothetical protein BCUN_2234 [Bifidobacterium cuniculi]|uniref:Uncharacterized protein n=2 Tax=Bifidobacterium cuniculi TaxID=1688 RepID=A0A087ADS9_9BIFI|nr:hypothetical protein BCUN_2234 [Bifidobacterium cuniculi]
MLILLAPLAACGDTQQEAAIDPGSQPSATAIKIAASIPERIEYLLSIDDNATYPMSEAQKEILRRAVENGGTISKADYDRAWSNYQQCMVNKGYTTPQVPVYENGLRSAHMYPIDTGRTEAEMDKLAHDDSQCRSQEYLIVDESYRDAIGNPDLYAEQSVAITDCLRREKLVPASYTARQFEEEQAAYREVSARNFTTDRYDETGEAASKFSFDIHDPKSVTCFVSNGNDTGQLGEQFTGWQPFK